MLNEGGYVATNPFPHFAGRLKFMWWHSVVNIANIPVLVPKGGIHATMLLLIPLRVEFARGI